MSEGECLALKNSWPMMRVLELEKTTGINISVGFTDLQEW